MILVAPYYASRESRIERFGIRFREVPKKKKCFQKVSTSLDDLGVASRIYGMNKMENPRNYFKVFGKQRLKQFNHFDSVAI